MKNRGYIVSFLVIILAIGAIVYGIYYYFAQGTSSGTNQLISGNTTGKITDAETYKSASGFSFNYPSDYVIAHESSDEVQITNSQKCTNAFRDAILFDKDCLFYSAVAQKNKITAEGADTVTENVRINGISGEKITITGETYEQILLQFQKNGNWYIQTLTFDRTLKNQLKLYFISNSFRVN